MRWLPILLLLTGCITTNNTTVTRSSSRDTDLPLYYIDSELVMYLASFKIEAHKQNYLVSSMPVTLIFGKSATREYPTSIGVCSVTNGKLLIKIDRKYYFKSDVSHREELVFHELAHCLADREHCDYIDPSTNRNISLMSTSMREEDDYKGHRDEYLKELFHIDGRCK